MEQRIINPKKMKFKGANLVRIVANRIHVCTEVVLTLKIRNVENQVIYLLSEMPDRIRNLVNAEFNN